MNICCVYTTENYVSGEKPLPNLLSLHFGVAYIASMLKKAGCNIRLLVITPQTKADNLLRDYIQEHRPGLFCLTAVTNQYAFVLDIARKIQSIDPDVYIIIGGNHASLNPEETIKEDCFDALCIMEGENAVVEYASLIDAGKEPSGIQNLWIRHRSSGMLEKNEQAHPSATWTAFPTLTLICGKNGWQTQAR